MAAAREKRAFEAARASIDLLVTEIKTKPAINFLYRFGIQPCSFNQIQVNPAGITSIANEAVDRMTDYFVSRLNTNQPLLSEVAGLNYLYNNNAFTYAPHAPFNEATRTYGSGDQFYQAMAHYSLTNGMLQSVKQEATHMQREIANININNNAFPQYLRTHNNRDTAQWIDEITTAIITDSGADGVDLPAPSGKQLTMALSFMHNNDFLDAIQDRIDTKIESMHESWSTLVRTAPGHWLTNMASSGYIDNLLLAAGADVDAFVVQSLKDLDIEDGVDGGMILAFYKITNPLHALNLQWPPLDRNDIATIETPANLQQPDEELNPANRGAEHQAERQDDGAQPPPPLPQGGREAPRLFPIPLLPSICKAGPGAWFAITDRDLNKFVATIGDLKLPDLPQPFHTTVPVIPQVAEDEIPCRMFIFQDYLRKLYYALPLQHRTPLFHRNYQVGAAQQQYFNIIQEATASRIVDCLKSEWASQHKPNWMAKLSVAPPSPAFSFKVFDLVMQICTAYIGPPTIISQGVSLTQDILQTAMQNRDWPNESFVEWISPVKISHQMLEDFAPMTGQPRSSSRSRRY